MCVAVVWTSNPTVKAIAAMQAANPHGVGVAWRAQDGVTVRWRKRETWAPRDVATLIATLPKPVLYHARLASIGAVCNELAHPFPISAGTGLALQGCAPAVLIHNGHWPEWEIVGRVLGVTFKGQESDSRMLARLIHDHGWDRIADALPGQRLAMLDKDGFRISGKGWDKDAEGNWFSNRYWQRDTTVIPTGFTRTFQDGITAAWWDQTHLPAYYRGISEGRKVSNVKRTPKGKG